MLTTPSDTLNPMLISRKEIEGVRENTLRILGISIAEGNEPLENFVCIVPIIALY